MIATLDRPHWVQIPVVDNIWYFWEAWLPEVVTVQPSRLSYLGFEHWSGFVAFFDEMFYSHFDSVALRQ